MNPPGDVEQAVERLKVPAEARIEEIIIGVADVASESARPFQLVFDGGAVVRQHAAKRSRHTSIPDDTAQERDVGPNGFERAGWVEEHEPILKHQSEPFESVDGSNVFLDCHLLVEDL